MDHGGAVNQPGSRRLASTPAQWRDQLRVQGVFPVEVHQAVQVSKYAYEKYGTSVSRPPDVFSAKEDIEDGCMSCLGDIYTDDLCSYYENKLMHADCAENEWALDL